MRSYKIPEKPPDESNDDWLRRAAESIPAEDLMRQLVVHLMRPQKGRTNEFARWTHAWSFVGDFTGHGSGISGAIVTRFMEKADKEVAAS